MTKTHIPNQTQERESARMEKAYKRHLVLERRMVRAVNLWLKSRESMKTKGRRAEKKIGGELDWRDLADREPPLGEAPEALAMLAQAEKEGWEF